MTAKKKIVRAIALSAAIGGAAGLLVALLRLPPAVEGALIAIVVGTGIARRGVSRMPKGSKCN
jgi:hypothetical protein